MNLAGRTTKNIQISKSDL